MSETLYRNDTTLGMKIGQQEIEMIIYLGKNPGKNNQTIAEDMETKKSNISHRLTTLQYKGFIHTEKGKGASKLRYLSEEGLALAAHSGVDVFTLLNNYKSRYDMCRGLLELDEILKEEVGEKWMKARSEVMYGVFDVAYTLSGYSEEIRGNSAGWVIVDWAKKNLSKKQAERIGKKILKHQETLMRAAQDYIK